MSKNIHHYIDNDFNPEHSSDYTLLVLVGQYAFSYAITGHNKVLVFEPDHGLEQLSGLTGENNLLFANYKQRIICLPYNSFTFVPVSVFRPDKVADFARFLDVGPTEKIFSQPLDADNQVIYKLDEGLSNIIADKFDLKNVVFAAKGWIMAIAASNPQDETIYLNIAHGRVEVLNFKDSKLRFYNSFAFTNPDELVYFCSLVTQELGLNNQYTNIIISGDVDAGDKNSRRLAEFFHKVNLNQLQPVALSGQIASHRILTLTALALCGSSEAN